MDEKRLERVKALALIAAKPDDFAALKTALSGATDREIRIVDEEIDKADAKARMDAEAELMNRRPDYLKKYKLRFDTDLWGILNIAEIGKDDYDSEFQASVQFEFESRGGAENPAFPIGEKMRFRADLRLDQYGDFPLERNGVFSEFRFATDSEDDRRVSALIPPAIPALLADEDFIRRVCEILETYEKRRLELEQSYRVLMNAQDEADVDGKRSALRRAVGRTCDGFRRKYSSEHWAALGDVLPDDLESAPAACVGGKPFVVLAALEKDARGFLKPAKIYGSVAPDEIVPMSVLEETDGRAFFD